MRALIALFLLCFAHSATAQGWDPPTPCGPQVYNSLISSVASIEYESGANASVKTLTKGTAWLLNKNTLVTIEHVITSENFGSEWKAVTLRWGDAKDASASHSLATKVRLKEFVGGGPGLERLALLELEHYLPGAKPATIAVLPLRQNEAVVGIGYLNGKVRFAEGRLKFPELNNNPTEPDKNAKPYLPFELWDSDLRNGRNDRHVFDHGTSGSPIANCKGEVAAVAVAIKASTMRFAIQSVRVTTPWGMANNFGVSTSPLLGR